MSSLEVSLAKAYDDLVESRDSTLPFAEEAALVAVFTRLYIQNLFNLVESDFKNVVRINNELNTKATALTRNGKNPDHLLYKYLARQDNFSKILQRYLQHLGALDCILDIRATAALVHHLVCLVPADGLPHKVTGCEFGAGTGILSVAGTIPFVGKGKIIFIQTFEQSRVPREDAQRIVDILQRESRYKDQIRFHLQEGDVTSDVPYQKVRDGLEDSGPLALWISETFGHRSQKPVVSEDAKTLTFTQPTGVVAYSPGEEAKYDPLKQVIEHSSRYFEGFLEKIRSRHIVAFPDIVTPRVIIDGKMSSMLLADGNWMNLHEIGQPYKMLPACPPSRWYFEEKSLSPQKILSFKTSPKKTKKKR